MNNLSEFITTYLIFIAIYYLLSFIVKWKLFKLAGHKPIHALIPIKSDLTTLRIIERPSWWVFLIFIPIIGWILQLVILYDFVRVYGKRTALDTILVIFLSYLYVGFVNYSPKTKYVGPEKRYETWVSSILFAVIFATLIHTYLVRPYAIPTSSLEGTLLRGDFLFVNNMAYGYRIPMTPLGIPFLQNTIPKTGAAPDSQIKSYIDFVRLPYMRLPAMEKLERDKIVVFNYPTDSVHTAIDRKDPYVKRLKGMPGDEFSVKDGRIYINGKPESLPVDAQIQHTYMVYTTGNLISDDKIYKAIGNADYYYGKDNMNRTVYQFMGITQQEFEKLLQFDIVDKQLSKEEILPVNMPSRRERGNIVIDTANSIFPLNKNWNIDQYGPLRIPAKGDKIAVNSETIPIYYNILLKYEGNNYELKNGKIIDKDTGKEVKEYTIKQDYYYMIGDNRDSSLDSRFFGFVPEDHILGKPFFIWMSLEGVFEEDNQQRSGGNANPKPEFKVRTERMFKVPNNNTAMEDKTNFLPYVLAALLLYFGWDYFTKKKKHKEEKHQL